MYKLNRSWRRGSVMRCWIGDLVGEVKPSILHYNINKEKRQQNKLALISIHYLKVPLFTPTFPICFIHLLKLLITLMLVSTVGKLPCILYGWIDGALTWWRFLEMSLLNDMYSGGNKKISIIVHVMLFTNNIFFSLHLSENTELYSASRLISIDGFC